MVSLRIGDLARAAGVAASAIRYYERLGLLPPAGRTLASQRVYDKSAVSRLEFIERAKALGLRLEQIREIVRIRDQGEPPCGHVRTIVAEQLDEIERRLADLAALREDLRRLAEEMDVRRDIPDGCVCGYIERTASVWARRNRGGTGERGRRVARVPQRNAGRSGQGSPAPGPGPGGER